MNRLIILAVLLSAFSCNLSAPEAQNNPDLEAFRSTTEQTYDQEAKVIHVMVALCDNENQGIVPVPAKIGNGQDPFNNLYWGALYGVKNYFKRSDSWTLLKTNQPNDIILERAIFKHKHQDVFLVADACDGRFIKETTINFLESSAGLQGEVIDVEGRNIGLRGLAKLLAYIGHDGLMDFQLERSFKNKDGKERDVIVLACASKNYFNEHLADANARPLVWTTGLMAPEAYSLHDALTAYLNGESDNAVSNAAAKAYAKYQRCSIKAAQRLLVNN